MRWAEKCLRLWLIVAAIIAFVALISVNRDGFVNNNANQIFYMPKYTNLESMIVDTDIYASLPLRNVAPYYGNKAVLLISILEITKQIVNDKAYLLGMSNDAAQISAHNVVNTSFTNAFKYDNLSFDSVTEKQKAEIYNSVVSDIIQWIDYTGKSVSNRISNLGIPINTGDYSIGLTDSIRPGLQNNIDSTQASSRTTACAELKSLLAQYRDKITKLRSEMKDLSGTEGIGVQLKSENMSYQYQFGDDCDNLVNTTQLSGLKDVARQSCMGLASQDDVLYNTVLPAYDTTNTSLFTQEITINDNIQMINDTIALIGCDLSDAIFSADSDVGTINVDEIRDKLNELSPYYISPGTLDYITKYLVGNGILDTALYSSSQILHEVNGTLNTIKGLTDKIF